jgi:eukaryotic-like serine/threonine-protein kinase
MVTYPPANAPPDSAPPTMPRKFGPLAAPLPEVGALVLGGKYRIEELLGVGGMGVVMAAEHVTLGQKVAFKFLAPGRGASVPRFLREARAAACINSEYVARVSDVGELEGGVAYMLMERLYGEDIGTYVRRAGPRPVDEAVLYILQACDAIAAAHAAGVIHRDLKPSNLFLARRPDGTVAVKLLDFGISKLASGESLGDVSLTNPGVMLGSPRYMSPEQVRDPKQVDARTDLWSLGVVLYELLTGAPMFDGEAFPALCLAVVHDEATPLRAKRPDAPEALEAALLRCVQKDPERRFSSAVELARALAPFGPPQAAAIVAQMARHGGGLASARASDRPSALPLVEGGASSVSLPVASSLQSCHAVRRRPLALALAAVGVCASATFAWYARPLPKPVRLSTVDVAAPAHSTAAVAAPVRSSAAVATAGAPAPSASTLPLISIDELPRDLSAAPMTTSSADAGATPPAVSQLAPAKNGKPSLRPPAAGLSATARKPKLPSRSRGGLVCGVSALFAIAACGGDADERPLGLRCPARRCGRFSPVAMVAARGGWGTMAAAARTL